MYKGIFVGDYKTIFREKAQELDSLKDIPAQHRILLSDWLIEEYFAQVGKIPDSQDLQVLSTWIVSDYDSARNKVTKTEYPILSEGQQAYRKRRELANNIIDFHSTSSKHKINGKRSPKGFQVFGEYSGS